MMRHKMTKAITIARMMTPSVPPLDHKLNQDEEQSVGYVTAIFPSER